jgi:hypothetical protein
MEFGPRWLPRMGRSRPTTYRNSIPFVGIEMYDAGSGLSIQNVTFKNLQPNNFRQAGALGTQRNAKNMPVFSNVNQLSFENAMPVYYEPWFPLTNPGDFLKDGPRSFIYHDLVRSSSRSLSSCLVTTRLSSPSSSTWRFG